MTIGFGVYWCHIIIIICLLRIHYVYHVPVKWNLLDFLQLWTWYSGIWCTMFPGVFLYHWLLIGVHNFLCTLDDFLHYLRIQVVLFSLILLHDVVLSLTFVWFVFCPASWSSAASWQLEVGPCQLCCVVVRCARAYTWSTRETAHRHYTH